VRHFTQPNFCGGRRDAGARPSPPLRAGSLRRARRRSLRAGDGAPSYASVVADAAAQLPIGEVLPSILEALERRRRRSLRAPHTVQLFI